MTCHMILKSFEIINNSFPSKVGESSDFISKCHIVAFI